MVKGSIKSNQEVIVLPVVEHLLDEAGRLHLLAQIQKMAIVDIDHASILDKNLAGAGGRGQGEKCH